MGQLTQEVEIAPGSGFLDLLDSLDLLDFLSPWYSSLLDDRDDGKVLWVNSLKKRRSRPGQADFEEPEIMGTVHQCRSGS